jgi:hypothetical protein
VPAYPGSGVQFDYCSLLWGQQVWISWQAGEL